MDYQKKRMLSNELSIRNTEANLEHRKLLEILNELVEHIEYKKNRSEFAKILTKMTNFSLTYFKEEKEYIKTLSTYELAELKISQKNYIFKVAMYNANLLSENPPDPKEIIEFLKKWWLTNILSHS